MDLDPLDGEVESSTLKFPPRAGATPKEWEDLLNGEWPLEDVLPTVLDPSLEIHPTSRLSAGSIGRLPSEVIAGYVMGVPGWPSAKLPPIERRLPAWRADASTGYGIRTNQIHFIDVDIDNPAVAERVRELLCAFLQTSPPERGRPGSSRFAVPIRVRNSNMRKSVVRLPDDGNIELLAQGNFIILAGTHVKSGTRYEWRNLEDGIPELSVDEFKSLAKFLTKELTGEDWIEPRAYSGEPAAGGEFDPTDPIVDFITMNRIKPGGRRYINVIDIVCPFEDSHTSSGGASDTSLLVGGDGTPFIKCLHSHCSDRTQDEFLSAMGYYDSQPYKEHSRRLSESLEPLDRIRYEFNIPRLTRAQVLQGFDIKGMPAGHFYVGKDDQAALVSLMCNPPALGVDLRHDTFTGTVIGRTMSGEVVPRGPELDRLVFSAVESLTGSTYPMAYVREILGQLARYRGHDSALDWADTLEWDGVPRIDSFFSKYIPVKESLDHAKAAARYWWLSAAARLLEPTHGAKADILVTLKGTQGTRKSSAVEAMAPPGFHSAFAPEHNPDKRAYEDRYRKMRGKLVIEMPEFMGESQIDHVQTSEKNFLSSQFDTWVDKFLVDETRRVRRCMFFATTNRFALYDATGVRRHCLLNLRPGHVIDTDLIARDANQIWAEAVELYSKDRSSQSRAHIELEKFQKITLNAAFVSCEDSTDTVETAIRMLALLGQPITETALMQSVVVTSVPRGSSRSAIVGRLITDFLSANGITRSLADRKSPLQIPEELMTRIMGDE